MTNPGGQSDVVRLCKDCRWYERAIMNGSADYDKCNSPQNIKPNLTLIRGETVRMWNYCDSARKDETTGCGVKAKWFAPRNDAELHDGIQEDDAEAPNATL